MGVTVEHCYGLDPLGAAVLFGRCMRQQNNVQFTGLLNVELSTVQVASLAVSQEIHRFLAQH